MKALWVKFLRTLTTLQPCPMFYQYLMLVASYSKFFYKAKLLVSDSLGTDSTCILTLSYEEENAL